MRFGLFKRRGRGRKFAVGVMGPVHTRASAFVLMSWPFAAHMLAERLAVFAVKGRGKQGRFLPGKYLFGNFLYVLRFGFRLIGFCQFFFGFGEPLEEIDSNIDPDTGLSAPIQLRSGQTIRNADIGFTEYK